MKESDLDISLTGTQLTISGKREAEQHEESDTWFAYERTFGSFSRSFTLPESADAEQVRAEPNDGVLSPGALHCRVPGRQRPGLCVIHLEFPGAQ